MEIKKTVLPPITMSANKMLAKIMNMRLSDVLRSCAIIYSYKLEEYTIGRVLSTAPAEKSRLFYPKPAVRGLKNANGWTKCFMQRLLGHHVHSQHNVLFF
jgi:hypothetical protein